MCSPSVQKLLVKKFIATKSFGKFITFAEWKVEIIGKKKAKYSEKNINSNNRLNNDDAKI